MSDADAESTCSTDGPSSYESSLISKPSSSASKSASSSLSLSSSSSSSSSCRPSSSEPLYKFINYDPFGHRKRSHRTSYSSVALFVCRSVGLGLLCMPSAFQQVGAVVGLALCVHAGLTFNYSYTLLCRFKYKICQIHRVPTVPYYSYQSLIEYSLALGPKVISSCSKFFKFMFIFMNLALNFGTSCVYMKYVSSTIQDLSAEVGIYIETMDVCLMYTVLCFAFLFVPSTKYLKPLSLLGQIACTILLSYIGYVFTSDIQIDSQSMVHGDSGDIHQFFGILLFSFVPVVQVLRIEDELINPEVFIGSNFSLLNVSMIIVTNMYISIGLWGYFTYQNIPRIEYSVLTVMPQTRFLRFVKSCFTAHIVFSHQELCSEFMSLWTSWVTEMKHGDHTNYLSVEECSSSVLAWLLAATKIVFTTGSFLVAVTVLSPSPVDDRRGLDRAMAFMGYLGNAWNVLIYPFVVELCLTHALHGLSRRPYVVAKDACFIVFGLSTFAWGMTAVVSRSVGRNDAEESTTRRQNG